MKRYVQRKKFLHEKAIPFTSLDPKKVALFIHQDKRYRDLTFLLFDRDLLPILDSIENSIELDSEEKQEIFHDYFLGMLVMEQRKKYAYQCYQVLQSAAKTGYGPLMYDIGMSYAGKFGIAPDRGSVSKGARKVWDYYFYNRKDVKKKMIDDLYNPITPRPEDDWIVYYTLGDEGWVNDPLNYVYYATSILPYQKLIYRFQDSNKIYILLDLCEDYFTMKFNAGRVD